MFIEIEAFRNSMYFRETISKIMLKIIENKYILQINKTEVLLCMLFRKKEEAH